MMATTTNMNPFLSCFRELCKRFPQCIRYLPKNLSPPPLSLSPSYTPLPFRTSTPICRQNISVIMIDDGSKEFYICPECVEAHFSKSFKGDGVDLHNIGTINFAQQNEQVNKLLQQEQPVLIFVSFSNALRCSMILHFPALRCQSPPQALHLSRPLQVVFTKNAGPTSVLITIFSSVTENKQRVQSAPLLIWYVHLRVN